MFKITDTERSVDYEKNDLVQKTYLGSGDPWPE
jgi:hypothetical protein